MDPHVDVESDVEANLLPEQTVYVSQSSSYAN